MLVEGLQLPADTTLSALEDAVAEQRGSPVCTCGEAIEPASNRYEVLDRLVSTCRLCGRCFIDLDPGKQLCHLLLPKSAS